MCFSYSFFINIVVLSVVGLLSLFFRMCTSPFFGDRHQSPDILLVLSVLVGGWSLTSKTSPMYTCLDLLVPTFRKTVETTGSCTRGLHSVVRSISPFIIQKKFPFTYVELYWKLFFFPWPWYRTETRHDCTGGRLRLLLSVLLHFDFRTSVVWYLSKWRMVHELHTDPRI